VGDVTRKIVLGNNVWVGCRTLILKGSSIPDGSVIGAGSTVGGTFEKENTIILNESAKVKFEDIRWER
jgi:acetyltransferase-like isoleucine patch superfamily enzyme